MRETNQTDKLGRSGEPDKQTKIVRRSNRQIRLFVSVCLVTTLPVGVFDATKSGTAGLRDRKPAVSSLAHSSSPNHPHSDTQAAVFELRTNPRS